MNHIRDTKKRTIYRRSTYRRSSSRESDQSEGCENIQFDHRKL